MGSCYIHFIDLNSENYIIIGLIVALQCCDSCTPDPEVWLLNERIREVCKE